MVYEQDREASAVLLRLAVQHMSQHAAALTPTCYAVWYEYLAGINPRLTLGMDERLMDGGVLADASIEELYRSYCSEFSLEKQQSIREASQNVLGSIRQQAEAVRAHSHEFGGQLEQSASNMNGQTDAGVLRDIIAQLHGETAAVASSMHDLSHSLERSQEEIDELRCQLDNARAEALLDPLTGVMNRRGFDKRMEEFYGIARQKQLPLSLAVLDIDHFKLVNDSYGHLFGDRVIRGLAQILKANIKGRDTVARLGGEEFGLLLPETETEGALALCEKIRSTMAGSRIRRASNNQEIGGITVSIGVATLMPGEDRNAFFDRADQAMYAAKAAGRNQITVAQI